MTAERLRCNSPICTSRTSAMCVVELDGDESDVLMRETTLLNFVDELEAVDPELLALETPASPTATAMSSPGLSSPSVDSESVSTASWDSPLMETPASGSCSGEGFTWGAPPAPGQQQQQISKRNHADIAAFDMGGPPESFATLPDWVVHDQAAFQATFEVLVNNCDLRGDAANRGSPDKKARIQVSPMDALQPHNHGLLQVDGHSHEVAAMPASTEIVVLPSRPPTAREKDMERSRRRRKRQKDELTYLRAKIGELEANLERLRRTNVSLTEEGAAVCDLVPRPKLLASTAAADGDQGESNELKPRQRSPGYRWERIANYQKAELTKSQLENVRLRSLAEQQLRVLKKLEIAFQSVRKPVRVHQLGMAERALHRGIFESEAAVFESLRVHLSSQYMETNRVYRASGLSAFDGDIAKTAVPRVITAGKTGSDRIYLENIESKIFPFSSRAVNEAIWHCLTNEDESFHPGTYQVFEANQDVVTAKITGYVRLPPQAETLVTVWLTVRRYEEEERVVTVWNGMVETEGCLNIKLHERGWNIIRPLLPTTARPNPSMCVTQTLMRVTPVTSARFDVKEVAVGTLANVLIGCYHRTVIVMHHVLEKLLLTEFRTLTCE